MSIYHGNENSLLKVSTSPQKSNKNEVAILKLVYIKAQYEIIDSITNRIAIA